MGKALKIGTDGLPTEIAAAESTALVVAVSGPNKLLGRTTSGEGGHEEIDISTTTENTTPVTGDWLLGSTSSGVLRRIDAGRFRIGTIISPSQITSNQNDYNPTGFAGADIVRFSTNALRLITGFVAPTHSRAKQLYNIGSESIVITAQDPSSSAVNRIDARRDIVVAPNTSIVVWYDSVSSRWRLEGQDEDRLCFNKQIETIFQPVDPSKESPEYTTGSGSGGTTVFLAASSTVPSSNRVSTGNTNSGIGSVYHRNNFANSNFPIFFRARIVTPSALSDATDTYTLVIGLINGNFGPGVNPNGAYLKYSHSVNSGVWQCVSRASGVETTLTASVTVVVSTVTEIVVCMRPDSTTAYWVNGTYVGEITTNYGTNLPMRPVCSITKTAGTTERFLSVTGIEARETR